MEEFKKPCSVIPAKKTDKVDLNNKCKEDSNINKNITESTKSQNPYKIPQWSDRPSDETNYSFEVLKSGQIIDEVKQLQKKAYWSFGRLQENDIEMAHPTISRFHAVLQYRPKFNKIHTLDAQQEEVEANLENAPDSEGPQEGWYIYDLGSTHGTFLNKQRIPPKIYIRIRVGHLLKLGASTRSYILQGPTEDEEPEYNLSITELKAKRQQEIEEAALVRKRLGDGAVEGFNNEGCSWGMAEDADEESDLAHNPYAISNNEELFLDDPKKTLRGYFEREGSELVYKCDEMSAGSFVCRIELPIDDANGRSIVAEVVHKGKKKDCVLQCALEACRILDRHGVLRQANQEPLRRKQKLQESDSDDDEFWDRTGDVARKKQRKATASTSVTLTYEDLLKKENDIDANINQIECKIKDYQEQQQRMKVQKSNDGEDLDAFMENLSEKEVKFDKTEIRKLRIEEQRLKAEKQKLQRLIKIAKPADIPLIVQPAERKTFLEEKTTAKKQLPMIGKRNQFNKFKLVKTQTTKNIKPVKLVKSDEEEIEDEEPDQKKHEENSRNNETPLEKTHLNESTSENTETILENPKENESNRNPHHNEKYEHKTERLQNAQGSEKNNKEIGSINKKRRQRIRQRDKREVDINDIDYESSEKYAKWLPPENQTGDGLTELNKKFGY